MAFTLRIYFMGLVALVPNSDRKSLSVVLQNAKHHPKHHRHFPVLVYPCGDLCKPCELPRDVCGVADDLNLRPFINIEVSPKYPTEKPRFVLDDAKTKTFGALRLDGERIAISPTVPGDLVFSNDGRVCHHWYHKWIGVLPANRFEGRDGAWLPKMSEISPRSAQIKKKHLECPDASEISALLRISNSFGTVRTIGLADRCGRVRTMTFKVTTAPVPLPRVRQATADVTLLELPISASKVVINLKKFDGGEQGIELQPRDTESFVEILVGNLTPLAMDTEINEVCQKRARPVDHFRLYYELTDPDVPFEQRPRAHFGWRSVVQANVEPRLLENPDVILVVSNRNGGDASGGVSRPACMKVELQSP